MIWVSLGWFGMVWEWLGGGLGWFGVVLCGLDVLGWFGQIADWVRAEALTDLQTQSAEMEATKQLPEYQQTRRRGLLAKYAEKWSTYNRKNGINGVLDAEGNIITEDLQAAHILSDHWQSVFAEKDCNVQLAERFLGKFARKLPPIQWILSESQFMEILGKLADSGLAQMVLGTVLGLVLLSVYVRSCI